MLVPLSICIAGIVLCGGLAFFSGFCLGFVKSAESEVDLRPQIRGYADLVREFDEPRLIEWTPATRQRFRYQQEVSRQMLASRRTA